MTRILLYTGEGGAGRTSVAAATALLSAERGTRLGPEPSEIAP